MAEKAGGLRNCRYTVLCVPEVFSFTDSSLFYFMQKQLPCYRLEQP